MATIRGAMFLAAVALVVSPRGARAGDEHAAKMAAATETPSPEFDRLKALAGEWEGLAKPEGEAKAIPTRATIKVVSAGSAVMLVTDPGMPHEMVTMFHRDGEALLATHYCSAMNQPRMKARAGSPAGTLTFEFVDGTNLGPHPGRMQGLVLGLPDADHQTQRWIFKAGAAEQQMLFELKRVKS
jgi:hypothetical protein